MKKEEIIRVELIREEVRKVLNQVLDEEYEEIIKDIEDGKTILSSKSIDDIIEELQSLKREE